MIKAASDNLLPRHIRLDIATACQLKCPACPTASGETGKRLGTGFLKLETFKRIIDENPWLSAIELSNWGEIFLNKDLPDMLRYAYQHNVALYAANGANLNTVKEETLEALVKYKLRYMTCSIDGATQETYVKYRVNGNLDTVLANIRRINHYKAKYRTSFPKLRWQYVAFGHNEHEISAARRLAEELNMEFYLKLSWDDLYTKEFSPVRDKDTVRRESGLGVASREEHRQLLGSEYVERKCCIEIWKYPQVNIDGRVLGCSVNYWSDFGNAFSDGLKETLNGESINYARAMLMGKAPAKKGIACTTCKIYHRMAKSGQWAREEETASPDTPGRFEIMLENKIFGVDMTRYVRRQFDRARHPRRTLKNAGRRFKDLFRKKVFDQSGEELLTLKSGVYPLDLAQERDIGKNWRAYPKFKGSSRVFELLSCHSSVLAPGHCPHPPHTHRDEEILMMLSGEAKLILPSQTELNGLREVAIHPGQCVYYPAGYAHTLQATLKGPANYLMFKWYAPRTRPKDGTLGHGFYNLSEVLARMSESNGFSYQVVFEGPTENLSKLHCHVSRLLPGAGYKPHADPYDVAIVVLEGAVETLGQRVEPQGVIYYRAGELHGIHNPGAIPAQYVVFEFHGQGSHG